LEEGLALKEKYQLEDEEVILFADSWKSKELVKAKTLARAKL
jgi:hypothetical protein